MNKILAIIFLCILPNLSYAQEFILNKNEGTKGEDGSSVTSVVVNQSQGVNTLIIQSGGTPISTTFTDTDTQLTAADISAMGFNSNDLDEDATNEIQTASEVNVTGGTYNGQTVEEALENIDTRVPNFHIVASGDIPSSIPLPPIFPTYTYKHGDQIRRVYDNGHTIQTFDGTNWIADIVLDSSESGIKAIIGDFDIGVANSPTFVSNGTVSSVSHLAASTGTSQIIINHDAMVGNYSVLVSFESASVTPTSDTNIDKFVVKKVSNSRTDVYLVDTGTSNSSLHKLNIKIEEF